MKQRLKCVFAMKKTSLTFAVQFNTLYYGSPIRGYSVVIYNDSKYTIINYNHNEAKNIYTCCEKNKKQKNKKNYLHEFICRSKDEFRAISVEFPRKWETFLLKLEILFIFRMSSGRRF